MTQPAEPPRFGPWPHIVKDQRDISPQALEGIAQFLEARGIRTPVSSIVGYQADLIATRVSQSLNLQTITSGTQTNMQFDFTDFDATKLFDAAVDNAKLTIRVPGIYMIDCGVSWPAGAAGTLRGLFLIVNGVPRARSDLPPFSGLTQSCSTFYKLLAGDAVRAAVFQDSGGNVTLTGGSVCFVGAALLNRYA